MNEIKIKNRVNALDTFKGIMLVNVLIVHTLYAGLSPESYWLWGAYFWVMDFVGAPGFLFAAGVSLSLTVRKKELLLAEQKITRKDIQKEVWFSSLFILGLAFMFNLIGGYDEMGWQSIWAWNVLQTIAITRIACFYCLRLRRTARLIIAFIIVGAAPLLFSTVSGLSEISHAGGVLYYILFNPSYADTFIPYVAYTLVGTIIGDGLYRHLMEDPSPAIHKDPDHLGDFRLFLIKIGLLIIMISIWLGAWTTTNDSHGTGIVEILSRNPAWNPVEIPLMFFRASYANVIFNIGMDCTLLGVLLLLSRQTSKRHQEKHKFDSPQQEPRNLFSIVGLRLMLRSCRVRREAFSAMESMICAGRSTEGTSVARRVRSSVWGIIAARILLNS